MKKLKIKKVKRIFPPIKIDLQKFLKVDNEIMKEYYNFIPNRF